MAFGIGIRISLASNEFRISGENFEDSNCFSGLETLVICDFEGFSPNKIKNTKEFQNFPQKNSEKLKKTILTSDSLKHSKSFVQKNNKNLGYCKFFKIIAFCYLVIYGNKFFRQLLEIYVLGVIEFECFSCFFFLFLYLEHVIMLKVRWNAWGESVGDSRFSGIENFNLMKKNHRKWKWHQKSPWYRS